MKRKMKKRITQRRRQQRSIEEMLKHVDKPAGATHFNFEHNVFYRKTGEQWSYFESYWGEYWVDICIRRNELAQLVKIEVSL